MTGYCYRCRAVKPLRSLQVARLLTGSRDEAMVAVSHEICTRGRWKTHVTDPEVLRMWRYKEVLNAEETITLKYTACVVFLEDEECNDTH